MRNFRPVDMRLYSQETLVSKGRKYREISSTRGGLHALVAIAGPQAGLTQFRAAAEISQAEPLDEHLLLLVWFSTGSRCKVVLRVTLLATLSPQSPRLATE